MLKYIELSNDKKPMTKFTTFVRDLDTIENAGLLLNNKTIVLDFDGDNTDEQTIVDYLTQHFPTQTVTTNKGTHLYYSMPKGASFKSGADKITNGGFQVDYKTGANSYTMVKRDGVMRNGAELVDLKDLPELPFIAYPLPKAVNITGLGDGDGRNSALFVHLRYIREQLGAEHVDAVADFVNTISFETPLDQKELEQTIASVKTADINANGNYNGKPTDMVAFGKFLVKELDVQIYLLQVYYKAGLHYSREAIALQQKVSKFLDIKRAQFKELEFQLETHGKMIPPNTPFKVKLRNGVIVEDQVIDSEFGFTPFFLDVAYVPSAYDKTVDEFLNFVTCDRKDLRLVIEEIIGHILMVKDFPHKLFFLTGNGANGKSTFMEMMTQFAGDLSSHIDISKFDDGTSMVSLIGKLVNMADDIDAIYLEKSHNLKTMASGNTVSAREIYGRPVNIVSKATLIFTANEPPTFKDKSDGIGRRLLIIPFDNKVGDRRIRGLDKLLSTDEAKSYLLNLGLQGIGRIIANNLELSTSTVIKKATDKYHRDNDSVLGYVSDYPKIEGNMTSSVYEAYEQFCEDSNLKPVSMNKFIRRLNSIGYEVTENKMVGYKVKTITKEGKK